MKGFSFLGWMYRHIYTINKMVCSICREAGHNASRCEGQFIREWTDKIKRFWVYGYNNSVENDREVKDWVRTSRLTMPIINRLWEKLREVYLQKRWWRLVDHDRQRFVQTRFYQNRPRNVYAFKNRITSYVRPTEQEPIDDVLAEYDRRQQEMRQQRQQQIREEQERRDRIFAERAAARQMEAIQDPNAQVRRNLRAEFDRANQIFIRVQDQAIRALQPKPKTQSIHCKMDTLETEYFENTDCPICLEPLLPDNTVALNCRHTCCVSCLKQTLKVGGKHNCPTCRTDIKTVHFKSTISPDHFNTISSHIHTLV